MSTDRRRASRPTGRRPRSRAEEGVTALELVVAMALLITISVMGFGAVGTMYGLSAHTLDSAQSATVSELAMRDLSQEGISANIVFDPASEGSNAGTNPDGTAIPAGFSLRMYTQNNGLYTCVQWRLLDTGALQVRQWRDGNSPGTNWSTLLNGVVNYAPPAPLAALTKPFVLDANSSYYGGSSSGGRLLDVDLLLDQHHAETPIEVHTSIAGRDAWYYPPNSGYCQTTTSR